MFLQQEYRQLFGDEHGHVLTLGHSDELFLILAAVHAFKRRIGTPPPFLAKLGGGTRGTVHGMPPRKPGIPVQLHKTPSYPLRPGAETGMHPSKHFLWTA